MSVNLMEFCCNWRAPFKRPFALDGHVVATDGKIVVCVSEWSGELGEGPGVDPKHASVLETLRVQLFADWAVEPIPIPVGYTLQTKQCWDCNGAGHAWECCPTCGQGSVENPNRKCPGCGGTGRQPAETRVAIGGVDFDGYLLERVRAIGVTELAPYHVEAERHRCAWRFNFPGGIGCIMPMARREQS